MRPSPAHQLVSRRPIALFLLAAAIASLTVTGVASAAQADEIDADGSLTTRSQSTVTLSVPVPVGVTPIGIRGRLRVAPGVTGRLQFSVGDRISRDAPARSTPAFFVPVKPDDLSGQSLEFRLTYSPSEACPAGESPADVVFDKLHLRYTGTPTKPTSLAAFFPPAASRVDVVIPSSASDDVIAAGLTAVAALSSRYTDDTPIVLNPATLILPRVDVTQRVVRLVPGSGPVTTEITTRFGLTTLILTGSGQDLVAAARALGSDQLDLATGGTTKGLGETMKVRDVSMTQTLADLGAATVQMSGPATVTQYVGVRQDVFGGPIDSLHIQVTGTHTALAPGTSAQLNTYLNGYLLDSQVLGESPELTIDTTADASLVNADNGLEFTLSTAGAGEDCSGDDALPIEVYFDGERSTVTGTRGGGMVTGFQTFPQVLGGELPVALRPGGPDRLSAAIDAAYIVSALQRAASAPLDVTLVDADEFLDGNLSGLLVGALEGDATELAAPLRLDGMRLIDYAEASFRVGTDQPYAALQAISSGGRDVLMLGSWAPTGADLPGARRTAARYVGDRGWRRLTDDLLVAAGERRPFTISSNAVVPQEEVVDERRPFIWWLIGGFAILGLLLGYQVWRTSRRDREVRQLVDAQVRADLASEDDDDQMS